MRKKRNFNKALQNSLDELSHARKHWEDIEKEIANRPQEDSPKTNREPSIKNDAQNLLKKLKNKLDDFS